MEGYRTMEKLQVGLLGPLEVHLGAIAIGLGGRNEQMVIAALAIARNKVVSTDSLLYALWNDEPPESALDTLQSLVSRLRGRLGHDVIELIDHSYRLAVEADQVDSVRFERVTAEATALLADDPSAASARAVGALELWRGTPFGDLADEEYLEAEVRRLDALRMNAQEVRLEGDVACGRLAAAVADLQVHVTENPYRERLWYLLVLALARDGRRVEALRACQELRADLGAIGLLPTADIVELEQMVLDEAPAVRSRLARCWPVSDQTLTSLS